MTIFSTLNALYKIKSSFRRLNPFFEASDVSMTYMITFRTFDKVSLFTIFSLMAYFIAFKAHFFSAFSQISKKKKAVQGYFFVYDLHNQIGKLAPCGI